MADDDDGVFEINDFTIITPLEELTAGIESLIQSWNLVGHRTVYPNGYTYEIEISRTHILKFGENRLKVDHMVPRPKTGFTTEYLEEEKSLAENYGPIFAAQVDVANFQQAFELEGDFAIEFGFREYLFIYPVESKDINTEDQCTTILGAIKTAIHSIRCELPFIVRVQSPERNIAMGYATDGNISFQLMSFSLNSLSKRHTVLAGLTEMFRNKAAMKSKHEEVRIASRFHYFFPMKYQDWERIPNVNSFSVTPFGPKKTLPIDGFNIVTTWKIFREDVYVETLSHCDFEIRFATRWAVSLILVDENYARGLMDYVLSLYMCKAGTPFTDMCVKEALGKYYNIQVVTNALDKMSFVNPSDVRIGSTSHDADNSGIVGPLPPSLISAWIGIVFGEENSVMKFNDELDSYNMALSMRGVYENGDDYVLFVEDLEQAYFQKSISYRVNYKQFKAAKNPSIAYRLAVAMTNVMTLKDVNPRAEPQLWLEFVHRLREKYENNQDIDPTDPSGEVDVTKCFLAQKLQLLQACVVARRNRMALLNNAIGVQNDEFYDAQEDFNDKEEEKEVTDVIEPKGRLKKFGGVNLVKNPKQPVYIPITQDRSPMTEDMLEKHTEYLFSLSEKERVIAQLEPLRSDMQCFKAANPGCVLEDFVRWHSPKDYDEKTGKLSERMQIPENTWIQCWEAAKPIPVINQTRLFNDTMLAEEVFELFENATISKVREWLKPIVFVSSFERIVSSFTNDSVRYDAGIVQAENFCKILQEATRSGNNEQYTQVAKWMSRMEIRSCTSILLNQLFEDAVLQIQEPHPSEQRVRHVVNELTDAAFFNMFGDPEMKVQIPKGDLIVNPQDEIGRALAVIAGTDATGKENYKGPERKEFVLTWTGSNQTETGAEEPPHRMYATIENEFSQACLDFGDVANITYYEN
ncbi:unnamed protein product [Caenorhabditis bovis]|uniref:Rab3 GTPase-activating protein catalytic subunit n=1 Tax=Caenorhabditis bovis TaxID=2654633 RepID=A0A8S1EHL1_9PELO|nr:unnamed protein product [Caenorhabditis bovis]